MLRQIYPVLLVTAVVVALAAYTHPHEASKWISEAVARTGDILDRVSAGLAVAADEVERYHQSTGAAPNPPAAGLPGQLDPAMRGVYGQRPQDTSADERLKFHLETARYPRADWAGDWQGFQNIPAEVRARINPVQPASAHEAPAPHVATTIAEVDRYLPGETPHAVPAVATTYDRSGLYPSTRSPVESTGTGQMQYPSTASVRAPAAASAWPGVEPRVPAGAEMRVDDPVANFTLCENARIIARIGSDVVLGSEILPAVDEVLQPHREKLSASQLKTQRNLLMQQVLQQRIEMKLLYADAKRTLPAEAIKGVEQQLASQFEKSEVSRRIKLAKVGSRRELEEKLASLGTSLERERRGFTQRAIAQQWAQQQLDQDIEVAHLELLDYYNDHGEDFDHLARARWEQLTARFSRHPDKAEAKRLIAEMGNEVMRGVPLAEVARHRSEGSTASAGGQRDWTTQASLKSDAIDEAIFGLPVGRLSQLLHDEQGLHIIRVIEREDAYRTPFVEAQVEIKEKIQNQRRQQQLADLLQRLRDEIPVWTVFDDETADAGGTKVW